MVTKSFGKRHFVQPMGRPKHALKVPSFFSFYVLGWRGEESFFSFFLASQCVCTMFLSSSQYFPQHFFHTSSLLSHICLGKWCPPFTYIRGPNGRYCTIQNRAFYIGESPFLLPMQGISTRDLDVRILTYRKREASKRYRREIIATIPYKQHWSLSYHLGRK